MNQGTILGSQIGKWLILVALVAAFAALLTASVVRAQDNGTIQYAENGTGPVATFTATDPEGVTPITWDVPQTIPNDIEGVDSADNVDGTHFDISEDGVLTFDIGGDGAPDNNVSPDFETPRGTVPLSDSNTNTYKVVVAAADAGGVTSYHKVTVMVTDVDEEGEVTWTTGTDEDKPTLMQFQVGALLTAKVEDGDIVGTEKTVAIARADVAAAPTWRWYRSSSKTSTGTMIDGANMAAYTVTTADVGMYLRAVAYYLVTGNVDQETASLTSDYPVLAVRAGNNKLKFDPATVSREVPEGEKGAKVGAPVRATGNHGAVNYTLVGNGNDSDKFKIDQKTGQITINVEKLDYEADAGTTDNCADTQNECEVTVKATDASGAATVGTATTGFFVDATVTIKLTGVNEKPEFITDDNGDPIAKTAIDMPENETDIDIDNVADVTYTATDPELRSLTYRLMGPDGAKFQLSDMQVLSFAQEPDYEMPADANKDNVYMVTVRASDGALYADRMVAVTVTGADEGPTVMGRDSVSYAENGEDPVATFTATDPEGATPITWTIAVANTDPDGVNGPLMIADAADALHFEIDKEDGVLTFNIGGVPDMSVSPDFEMPRDMEPVSGTNTNTYKVVVVASDQETGGMMGYHKVTVMVTNVAEAGKVTWTVDADEADTPTLMQFQVEAVLAATATDGDIARMADSKAVGTAESPTWRWYRGGARISGEETNTYTVTTADVGSRLRVEATYRVGDSTIRETASLTSDYPVLAVRAGDNKLKFDPATVSREVAEGEKGAKVGAPVRATGNHGAVNYTLVGNGNGNDSDKFKIDQKTGQITTNVDLDYDADADGADNCTALNSCEVTVRATDASGDATDATDPTIDATVTIKLTDVNEKPEFITEGDAMSPMRITREENNTPLFEDGALDGQATSIADVTYMATDPEELNVNLTLMGPDAAKFSLSSVGLLSFNQKPDYEMPADADRDNVYEVTVRASDGTLYVDRMVTVTVSDENEAPTILPPGLTVSGPSSRNYPENGTDAVGTYTASGSKAASARWTLEGDDRGDFKVDGSGESVMLKFRTSPNYEMPMDMGEDNSYQVTLKATDRTNMDEIMVTVTVDDVGELATLSGDSSPSYMENSDGAVETYTADGATWSLEGTDKGYFTITGGVLKFKSSPNYEMPRRAALSATNTNEYMVTVKAKAGGEVAEIMVTVTVANVEELGMLSGDSNPSYMENSEDAVETYTADGPMAGSAIWSLMGDDMGDLSISTSGTLNFRSAPDYEMPMGGSGNDSNTYMVTVKAEAGGEMAMVDVTVTVTNVEEPGTVTLMPMRPSVGTEITATLTDPDMMVSDTTWQWSRMATDGTFTPITGATSAMYTPVEADDGYYLQATASYTDGEGSGKTADKITESSVGLYAIDGPASHSYMENGTVAVWTYTASGDAETTWTLEGDDEADFTIMGGMLEFVSSPNYEMPMDEDMDNTYMVTVKAEAGGEMAMQEVTVMVTNVDELGTLGGSTSASIMEGATDSLGTYTLTAIEDGPTVTWSLDGTDMSDFMLEGTGMSRTLNFKNAPDYEMPADADGDNEYMVTVKAEAGGEMAMQEVTVMVTNVDELGTLGGSTSASIMEGATDSLGTYTLTAIEDGPTVTWSLDGTDMSDFMLEGTGMSRTLNFKNAPDYEMPADADGDNEYMVTVKAEAGGEMAMQEVTVMVTNVEEGGTVTLSPESPVVGSPVTATLTDLDGGITGTTWQWASADAMDGDFTNIDGADSASYTPVEDDAGMYLKATASYTDGEGSGKMAMATTTSMVTAGDPLLTKYDTNGDQTIDKGEVIAAIHRYFGGEAGITRAEVIAVIALYFGS